MSEIQPNGVFKCIGCKRWRSSECFGSSSTQRNGKCSYCRECMRYFSRRSYRRRKAYGPQEIKKSCEPVLAKNLRLLSTIQEGKRYRLSRPCDYNAKGYAEYSEKSWLETESKEYSIVIHWQGEISKIYRSACRESLIEACGQELAKLEIAVEEVCDKDRL